MNIRTQPQGGSYESTLTDEQRMEFRALLLSDITLADAQQKVLAWPTGPDIGKKPTIGCLGKIRVRLRLEEKIARIEGVAVTRRVTRNLLRRAVKRVDQEEILDQAMTFIGEQVIDASLGLDSGSTKTAAAWLLLRRADQRRFDRRAARAEAQSGDKEKNPTPQQPPLSEEEKEAKWRQIFGMMPEL